MDWQVNVLPGEYLAAVTVMDLILCAGAMTMAGRRVLRDFVLVTVHI